MVVNFQAGCSKLIFNCSLLYALTSDGGVGSSRLSQHPKTAADPSISLLSEKLQCCNFEPLMLLGLYTPLCPAAELPPVLDAGVAWRMIVQKNI